MQVTIDKVAIGRLAACEQHSVHAFFKQFKNQRRVDLSDAVYPRYIDVGGKSFFAFAKREVAH
jgi:hypothetical protein